MTNRELDNAIAVMQAYKDGKTIQAYDDIDQQWFDLVVVIPMQLPYPMPLVIYGISLTERRLELRRIEL